MWVNISAHFEDLTIAKSTLINSTWNQNKSSSMEFLRVWCVCRNCDTGSMKGYDDPNSGELEMYKH